MFVDLGVASEEIYMWSETFLNFAVSNEIPLLDILLKKLFQELLAKRTLLYLLHFSSKISYSDIQFTLIIYFVLHIY